MADITPFDIYETLKSAENKREKRKLSPEMEKAIADTDAMRAHGRAMENKATGGLMDRFRSLISGNPVEDEWEKSARLEEMYPRASASGGAGGHTLLNTGVSAGLAKAVPALAKSTIPSGILREGAAGGLTSLADEAIQSVQGRKEFSPENVVANTVIGGVAGAGGAALPRAFGHAPTIAARVSPTPLDATQKMGLDLARHTSTKRGFTGDAALDIAQNARLSGDRSMGELAANIEAIKGRANPSFQQAQQNAFQSARLDKDMAAATAKASPRPGRPQDLANISRAISDAPVTPRNMPENFPLAWGFTKIPVPNMTARNTRAAELLRDPAMADGIGRVTGAQFGTGVGARTLFEELEELRHKLSPSKARRE